MEEINEANIDKLFIGSIVSPPRTPSSLQENSNASLLIWNLKIQASHKSCRHI